MKLMTERGELALPADYTFTVEQNSPLFSNEGSGTVPATIPASPANLRVLGFPDRLGSRTRYVRKMEAKISAGTIHKDGVLVVDTVQRRGQVTVAVALAESDMYAKLCDRNIREMFENTFYFNHTADNNPAQGVASDLNAIYTGQTTSLIFALFPVAVTGTDGYLVMNEPQEGTGSSLRPLTWQNRDIQEGDTPCHVPDGYGLMPFVYLGRLLNMIFYEGGYTVTTNPFNTDPALSKIVVLHNTADPCCNGKVCLADLVPNITVSEMLEALEMRFHAYVRVTPEKKQVDIVMMENALASAVDMDLSPVMDGQPTMGYQDPKHVSLTPDTSLDGASPAAETIEDLAKKYPILSSVDETEITVAGHGQALINPDLPDVFLRKALGTICEKRYKTDATLTLVVVGTANMKYDKKMTDETEQITAKDLSPVMVSQDGMTMPYIGNRVHRNTSFNDDLDREADQKLMLCFAPGVASSGWYRYGTTQRWNDKGTASWNTWGMHYDDMYPSFFQRYNEMIMNNAVTVKAKIAPSEAQLQALDIFAMKKLESQRMLIEHLSYTVGRTIRAGEWTLRPVLEYEDQQVDPLPPVFQEQIYRWRTNTSQAQAKADSYIVGHNVVTWHFKETEDGIQKYLGPPTAAGLIANRREVVIVISTTSGGSWDIPVTFEDTAEIWEESYLPT